MVISDHNGIANNVGVANLLPYLTVGNNLVAFTVSDNYPVHGYNHAAWLQIDAQIAAVPEPTTTALMLAGLARHRLLGASAQGAAQGEVRNRRASLHWG